MSQRSAGVKEVGDRGTPVRDAALFRGVGAHRPALRCSTLAHHDARSGSTRRVRPSLAGTSRGTGAGEKVRSSADRFTPRIAVGAPSRPGADGWRGWPTGGPLNGRAAGVRRGATFEPRAGTLGPPGWMGPHPAAGNYREGSHGARAEPRKADTRSPTAGGPATARRAPPGRPGTRWPRGCGSRRSGSRSRPTGRRGPARRPRRGPRAGA